MLDKTGRTGTLSEIDPDLVSNQPRPTSTLTNQDLWKQGTPNFSPQPCSDSTQVLLTPAIYTSPRASSGSPPPPLPPQSSESSEIDPGDLPRRTPRPDSYPCWSYLEPDYDIETVPILSGMTDMTRITPRIILKTQSPSTEGFNLPLCPREVSVRSGTSSSALTLMSDPPALDITPTTTKSSPDVGLDSKSNTGFSFVELPSSSSVALNQQCPAPTFSRQESPPWFWLQGDYSYKGPQPNPKRCFRVRPPTSGRASRTPLSDSRASFSSCLLLEGRDVSSL